MVLFSPTKINSFHQWNLGALNESSLIAMVENRLKIGIGWNKHGLKIDLKG